MTNDNPNPGTTSGAPAAPASQPRQDAPGGATAVDAQAAVNRDAAGHAQRAASLSPAEIHQQAEKIMADKDSQYYKGGPDSDYQVALVYRHHELQAAAEGDVPERPSNTSELANRAIDLGQLPIPQANMTPEVIDNDQDLGNLLRYASSQNISTPTLRRALTAYANMLAGHGGQVTDEGIAQMEREVGDAFHPQQKALLIRWLKEEVAPNLAREAARRRR